MNSSLTIFDYANHTVLVMKRIVVVNDTQNAHTGDFSY